jgi:Domain of unknown function (DUF3520)
MPILRSHRSRHIAVAVSGSLAAALLATVACGVRRSARMAPQARYAMAAHTPTERPPGDHDTEAYDRIYDNPFLAARATLETTSRDFRFASAVVAFGLSLRSSPHRGQANYELVKRLAEAALPPDADEHRRELVALVGAAQTLAGRQ